MDFPDRHVALAWVGRTLVDRDGAEIGACTAVFSDDATQLTEWVCSELAGAAVFIPAVGAAESAGQVQVAVSRADVAAAPSVGDAQHISTDEEAALYRHYGIPHSREASPTLLPTGGVEPEPPAHAVASDAAAPQVVATPAAAEPVTAPAAAAEPVTAPAVAEDAAPRTQPASDAGQGQPDESAPPARRGRRIGPAVGGLVGVGLALGVALRARRQRRRPPTRTERLKERGRAASVALSARSGQIAASAAPLLQAPMQVLRRRPGTGAVAGGVPAAALAVAAVRRRRGSRNEPDN